MQQKQWGETPPPKSNELSADAEDIFVQLRHLTAIFLLTQSTYIQSQAKGKRNAVKHEAYFQTTVE